MSKRQNCQIWKAGQYGKYESLIHQEHSQNGQMKIRLVDVIQLIIPNNIKKRARTDAECA